MKHLHKRTIIILIGIAFAISLISDGIYGTKEIAGEYMFGTFLYWIYSLVGSLATIFIILYLVLRVICKDFIQMMFNHSYPINSEGTREIRKIKRKGNSK